MVEILILVAAVRLVVHSVVVEVQRVLAGVELGALVAMVYISFFSSPDEMST